MTCVGVFVLLLLTRTTPIASGGETDLFDEEKGSGSFTTAARRSVVGGTEVENGRYPYMVSLVDCEGEAFCGGSLIAPNWVLTSADCGGYAEKVQIGRHDLSSSEEEGEDRRGGWRTRSTYEEIDVDYERRHPMFFGMTMQNDFNLIKLKQNSTYLPVRLHDGNSSEVEAGTPVTVLGYGTIYPSGSEMSNVLQEATISVVSNLACNVAYFCYSQSFITPSMMCAYGFMKDACDGDYGGPLILKGEDATQDVQVGIVSWGAFCASPIFPGVYARVSRRDYWIERTIGSNEPFDGVSRLRFDAFRALRRREYKLRGKSAVVRPNRMKLESMKRKKKNQFYGRSR